MADKRISQLIERTDIANNDVLPIVASGATTTNKVTISTIQNWMQDNLDVGVTSVGITLGSSGTDVNVTGSPITTSGNITINIPTASATNRGLVSTGSQTFAGTKTFNSDIIVNGVNVGRGGTNVPSNTRVGNSALQDNTTGANNTAVGFSSLIFTTTGSSNTAVGHQVLSNANGSVNTAVGVSSLFNLSTGDNNLGLGNQAGTQISGGANHTTSNNSIFIGSDTKPAANNQINQIVIGHQAVGQGSNTVTIGNSSITSNKFFGRVIHADAVNADESATLGQVNTSLGGYVTLGTAQTITGSKTFNSKIIGQDATLTSSGSTNTLEVFHTSGSGHGVEIQKAGNGEGLRVIKTSGSGNAVTITGGTLSAEAGQFSGDLQSSTRLIAATGGQQIILTPNLATTSNRIETTGSLPLEIVSGGNIRFAAGGATPQITLATTGAVTLTGALNGTSASFGSLVTISADSGGSALRIIGRAAADAGAIRFFANNNTTQNARIESNSSELEINSISNLPMTFKTNDTTRLTISSTGGATFSSSVTVQGSSLVVNGSGSNVAEIKTNSDANALVIVSSANLQDSKTRIELVGTTNSTAPDQIFYRANTHTFTGSNASLGARVTINNSGNVGIGTASPLTRLDCQSSATGAVTETAAFRDNSTNGNALQILNGNNESRIRAVYYNTPSDQNLTFWTIQSNGSQGERMRITSGGFLKASNTGSYSSTTSSVHEIRSNIAGGALLVSNSNTSNPYGLAIVYSISPNNNAEFFIECADSTATRFIVRSNGNVSNTNGSYGAISDIKLKENIKDASPKLDDLMKVKVRNYNLIGEKTKQIGVIAQELEEVFPAMIEETPDYEEVEVPQVDEEGNEILNEEGEVVTTKEKVSKGTTTKSVKYSVFVPMLIKAMQEQQEQIKSLTEQVEALKSQING